MSLTITSAYGPAPRLAAAGAGPGDGRRVLPVPLAALLALVDGPLSPTASDPTVEDPAAPGDAGQGLDAGDGPASHDPAPPGQPIPRTDPQPTETQATDAQATDDTSGGDTPADGPTTDADPFDEPRASDDGCAITAVAPGRGPAHGGTAVTVTGRYLPQHALVSVGGAGSYVIRREYASLTVLTPPGRPGALVDVTVHDHSGQTATLPEAFRYE